MAKEFAIIGLDKFGISIAKNLYLLGNEVLAVDANPDLVNSIADHVTQAIQIDTTDDVALGSLGLHNYDGVVVCSKDNLQDSIMTTMLLIEMGIKNVVCSAQSELHERVLAKIGANKVILPERDMGLRVAHRLSSPKLLDISEFTPGYSLVEIEAHEVWVGKTLQGLDLRTKYGVNVLAIGRMDGTTQIAPQGKDEIRKGDLLVILGSDVGIKKIEEVVK